MVWSEMTLDVKGFDAKTNSMRLAEHVLGNHDWQVGVTKVFIKVHDYRSTVTLIMIMMIHRMETISIWKN